jgi:hypothetical protein
MYIFFILCLMVRFSVSPLFAMESMHPEFSKNPLEEHNLHICAFHIAKDNPNVVIETQHYCVGLKDDLFQCILFETTAPGKKPKLLGIEYVISDALYQKLSSQEKNLWHPHEYEVRQGLLALLDASKEENEKVMKILVKTWGKTWHTWPDPQTDLPLGFPRLMWSAIKDGDVPQNMVKERDSRWGTNTLQLKKERERYFSR